jgi:hypothetical protein
MTVFFATPCYRSDPQAALDWAHTTAAALSLKGSRACCPVGTLLTTSQAFLVDAFLKTECTAFFIREDDIFVEPDVLARMIAANVDAIIAPYLVRNIEPPRIDAVFEEGYKVIWAGVGCTLIQRHVIETMWAHYHEELRFMQEGIELVALFRDFFAQRDDGVQLIKPDHAFWYRVRECGFQIEALDDVIVDHAGNVSHFKKAA